MSISPHYFEYLRKFGTTETVGFLAKTPKCPDCIALRHDVDHDIDLALEMAYYESQMSIRSSYYVLPTAPYWGQSRFIDKCLQIQDFGHEVGLHVNILAQWFNNEVVSPQQGMKDQLEALRSGGVKVGGTSAHGDPSCYVNNFANYWIYSELRPDDPSRTENGIRAEGIMSDTNRSISYPADHLLERDDGTRFDLWSLSMKELSIDYEASRLAIDNYYSDSGGKWATLGDPISEKLSTGRNLILIHPEHYRAAQKIYFFLSTARSGSKWLSTMLDVASPLTFRHEHTLNVKRGEDGGIEEEKRTGLGFTDLLKNENEVKELLDIAKEDIENVTGDYGEANIYLAHVLPQLMERFPEAEIIHLHRDPAKVVRSIMNRCWYDTPDDSRHPRIEDEDWNNRSPYEKCCLYVGNTNKVLSEKLRQSIGLEKLTVALPKFSKKMGELGIPVYPRLAETVFLQVINANRDTAFPKYRSWSWREKLQFYILCSIPGGAWGRFFSRLLRSSKNSFAEEKTELLANWRGGIEGDTFNGTVKGADWSIENHRMQLMPEGDRHVHCLLGGGRWTNLPDGSGWVVPKAGFCQGEVSISIEVESPVQIFALFYDSDRKLIRKRLIARSQKLGMNVLPYSFGFRNGDAAFDIAIYANQNSLPGPILIDSYSVTTVSRR